MTGLIPSCSPTGPSHLLAPAARAAHERGDIHAAASLLRRAADLSPAGHERIELLIDLRAALRTVGEGVASDAADAEAVALLAEYPDEGLEHRRGLSEAHFAGWDDIRSLGRLRVLRTQSETGRA